MRGCEPHWSRFVIVVEGGQVATSGRRDYGNYDEGKKNKEDGKVEYRYDLPTIAKCKGVDWKEKEGWMQKKRMSCADCGWKGRRK